MPPGNTLLPRDHRCSRADALSVTGRVSLVPRAPGDTLLAPAVPRRREVIISERSLGLEHPAHSNQPGAPRDSGSIARRAGVTHGRRGKDPAAARFLALGEGKVQEPGGSAARTAGRARHAAVELTVSRWWVVLSLVLLAHGSLLPWNLSFDRLVGDGFRALSRITFAATTPDDIAANVLVYIPLGLVVGLARSESRPSVLRRVAFATLIGSGLSLGLEALQVCIPGRVPSWIDVILNTLGCFFGAVAGMVVRRHGVVIGRWLLVHARRRPAQVALLSLTSLLIVAHLAPFDFVTSTSELHGSFRRALWGQTALSESLNAAHDPQEVVEHVWELLWYAVLAALATRAALERHEPVLRAALLAFGHTVVVSIIVETLQLFVRSRLFDLRDMLLALLGALAGTWLALFIPRRALMNPSARSRRVVDRLLLIPAVVGYGSLLALTEWLGRGNALPTPVRLPFEQLWQADFARAAWSIASDTASFALLALGVAAILRTGRARVSWEIIAPVAVVPASLGSLAVPGAGAWSIDATPMLIAALGVALAAELHSLAQRLVTGSLTQVEAAAV